MNWTDLTTLAVALATAGLALVTYGLVRLSRSSLDLSIRPFLADPSPAEPGDQEDLLFGAPGRISARVDRGELFYQVDEAGAFHLSVAFENIGAGVAAIIGAEMSPSVAADIYLSRKFVPVGGIVRVNIAVLTALPGCERFSDQWWAMEGVSVSIRYTDANGKQRVVTRAVIAQAATRAPFVEEISVFREGESEPMSIGRGSY